MAVYKVTGFYPDGFAYVEAMSEWDAKRIISERIEQVMKENPDNNWDGWDTYAPEYELQHIFSDFEFVLINPDEDPYGTYGRSGNAGKGYEHG